MEDAIALCESCDCEYIFTRAEAVVCLLSRATVGGDMDHVRGRFLRASNTERAVEKSVYRARRRQRALHRGAEDVRSWGP